MKKSTARDYYYNTPDVFQPIKYRAELPEAKDLIETENPYILLHPRVLGKDHRCRRNQLAKITDLISSISEDEKWVFVPKVLVSLACNGNYVWVGSSNIMAFAHDEDIALWKEENGELLCDTEDKSDFHYGKDAVDDAVDDVNYRKEFMRGIEQGIIKKYGLPEDTPFNWPADWYKDTKSLFDRS